MKQRITVEQLQELTDEQKERLREWWKPVAGDYFATPIATGSRKVIAHIAVAANGELRYFDNNGRAWNKIEMLPLLAIGQMIELLLDAGKLETASLIINTSKNDTGVFDGWRDHEDGICISRSSELCDALFAAVKAVL